MSALDNFLTVPASSSSHWPHYYSLHFLQEWPNGRASALASTTGVILASKQGVIINKGWAGEHHEVVWEYTWGGSALKEQLGPTIISVVILQLQQRKKKGPWGAGGGCNRGGGAGTRPAGRVCSSVWKTTCPLCSPEGWSALPHHITKDLALSLAAFHPQ